MFTELRAFGLRHPRASKMLTDDSGLLQGHATLCGVRPVFIEGLPLYTWGSNQSTHSNGTNCPSFTAD